MKNALILHGAANNPSGNWFPWLKQELENKGYKVWVPNLPNSNSPVLKDWSGAVFSNTGWEFNEESVLIGHSTGATLILRILERLPGRKKMNKAVLVAGPVDKGNVFNELKEGVTEFPYDWDKIKNSSKEFYLIYSDNDPYDCGIRHGEVIKGKVGGKLILKKGQGHFNLEVGGKYREFPEILGFL